MFSPHIGGQTRDALRRVAMDAAQSILTAYRGEVPAKAINLMTTMTMRTSRTSDIDILVSEVGPRDGLQSVTATMPTAVKHRWIAALAEAGLREIEVASFVSPKRLPQMADTADVVAKALTIPT